MISVYCNDRKAWPGEREILTAGSLGQSVEFNFSEDWSDLQKYAVFVAYDKSITQPLVEDSAAIPPEVLALPGIHLFVGVYGVNLNGTVIIPTLYCDLGMIHPGANPAASDNYEEPTASMLAQLLALTKAAQLAASIAAEGAILDPDTVTFSIDSHKNLIVTITEEGAEPTEIDLGPITAYGDYCAAQEEAGETAADYASFQQALVTVLSVPTLLDGISDRLGDIEDGMDALEARVEALEEEGGDDPEPEPEPEPTPVPTSTYVSSYLSAYQQTRIIYHNAILTTSNLSLTFKDGATSAEKTAFNNARLNLQNQKNGQVMVVAYNPQQTAVEFRIKITQPAT